MKSIPSLAACGVVAGFLLLAVPVAAQSSANTPRPNAVNPPGSPPPEAVPIVPSGPRSATAGVPDTSLVDNRAVGTPPAPDTIQALDRNADGRISLSEFLTPRADSNLDLKGNATATNVSGTGAANANGANAATAGATPRHPDATSTFTNSEQLFRLIDADHDAYLTQTEINAYRAAIGKTK